jgi:hypothetical protein
MHELAKRPIDPVRIRCVPRQFGALDRNVVYGNHVRRLGLEAFALYALLVCVSDPLGLSYYSDRKLCVLLGLQSEELTRARAALVHFGLILHRPPFYQLLDLPRGCP